MGGLEWRADGGGADGGGEDGGGVVRQVDGWLDGQEDGWKMDGQVDRCNAQRADGGLGGCWMTGWTDEQMDRSMSGWVEGRLDSWVSG